MANQITDNRTILFQANSVTGDNGGRWDTLSSTSETLDTDVKIEGTGSIGEQFTSGASRALIWDNGTTFDISNTHVYVWVNCGIVGLLDTKAAGGFAVRFTGPSAANFFEYYVGGSDSWPIAIEGGWVQFVVDTAATASNTGGTPPAKTAVQGVGISGHTASVMTKVSDNTWVDACWTLAANTPGIIVEGRNGGVTDWTFADILTQLGTSSGAFRAGSAGEFVINAPLQIGINDTSTHGFTDSNATIFWDDQEWVAADHYGISALGNAGGTTNVTFGSKSGTGAAAVGSQGVTIQAASTGVRWTMDFDDANLDTVGLYGSNFIHGDTFALGLAAVDLATCLFLDCTEATVTGATVVRATVVDANTIAGAAFMITDDMGDIANSNFTFSAGHAIELNAATPTAQNNVGNQFTGYANVVDSTSAAILNSAAGAITISSSAGSNLQTSSYRNTGGGSVTIENNISVTFTGMKDDTQVRVELNSDNSFVAGIENVTAGSVDNRTFTWSAAATTVVNYVLHNFDNAGVDYESIRVVGFTVPASDVSIPIQQRIDRNSV
jgi:hypothetical protein